VQSLHSRYFRVGLPGQSLEKKEFIGKVLKRKSPEHVAGALIFSTVLSLADWVESIGKFIWLVFCGLGGFGA
jgi:hypothetical protein